MTEEEMSNVLGDVSAAAASPEARQRFYDAVKGYQASQPRLHKAYLSTCFLDWLNTQAAADASYLACDRFRWDSSIIELAAFQPSDEERAVFPCLTGAWAYVGWDAEGVAYGLMESQGHDMVAEYFTFWEAAP